MRQTYRYVITLLVGMLFVVPIGGVALSRLGLPLNPSLLVVLGLYLATWGSVILWNGDYKRGLLVSILVLITFGSFIPLGNFLPVSQLASLPIGPKLYLIDPPLLLLSAISLSALRPRHLTRAHGLLAGTVVWALLLVAIAPGPRPDVMLWYAVHLLRIALVFLVVSVGITEEWITARTAVGVVVLAVVGHAVAATAQLLTGPVEQLNVLGVNTRVVATLTLGGLTIQTGPYIGGLTGGAPFATHIVLIVPVVAAFLYTRIPAVTAVVGVAWLFILLQLTAWDAARGALFISGYLTALLFGWWLTGILWTRVRFLSKSVVQSTLFQHRWSLTLIGCCVAFVIQILQSRSVSPEIPAFLPPNFGQAVADAAAIPGFSTENLGIRLHQYVGGLDTFLKYPLTGLGGGNFQFISLSYNTKPPNMIHNMYIGVLAETGIVGGALYFGALGYGIAAVSQAAHLDDDPLLLALLAGVGGVLSLQIFQPQYLFAASMMPLWAVLGITTGRCCQEHLRSADRRAAALDRSLLARALRRSVVLALPDTAFSRLHVALNESRVWHNAGVLGEELVAGHQNCRLSTIFKKAREHSRCKSIAVWLAATCRTSRVASLLFK